MAIDVLKQYIPGIKEHGIVTDARFNLSGGVVIDNSTATATAGAATLNANAGVVTSEGVTTAAGAAYTLTLTNNKIAATDLVFASVANGTNSAGIPVVGTVTPGSGSVVIKVENQHGTNAFNGTLKIAFLVIKSA